MKLCEVCDRPLLSAKSIKDGMGPDCKRALKLEKENENQVVLRLGKEIPKELKALKGVCTKLRYKGKLYQLIEV